MSGWEATDSEAAGCWIIELVSEEELDAEIGGADGYKENIFSALTQINKALCPPVADPPHTSATAVTMPFTSNKVKLPKPALPRFGWNVLKWPTFWDSYESAVHHNRDLSDVDKFNYLRALLKHTAYDAIAG